MKKATAKIWLDLIMAALLALLYNSHVINITFHEIGGLFILLLFLVHCILNWKWITAITVRSFSRSLPANTRLGYIVVLLLLISFLLVVGSGVFFSQVLFPSMASYKEPWRTIHVFFSGVTIILLGVHVGLNWPFVSGVLRRSIRIPNRLLKPLSIGLILVVLAFGSYSATTSGFTGWLSSPFTAEHQGGGPGNVEGLAKEDHGSGDSNGVLTRNSQGEGREDRGSSEGRGPADGYGPSKGAEVKAPRGAEGSPAVVANTMATYLSMIGLFAVATLCFDRLVSRRRPSLT